MDLTIKKVLNSSVVLAIDTQGSEVIVLGKGIGYGKKSGAAIPREDVNQCFVPMNSPQVRQMEKLLKEMPPEIIDIAHQIVTYANDDLNGSLNDTFYFSLMDHIKFSIERLENNILFQNKLYWEVQNYYPKEFKIGTYAVDLINRELRVQLPKEEIASIAFHIINAEKSSDDVYDSMKVTKLLDELITIIRIQSRKRLEKESISYQRLITHIKFFAERLLTNKQLNGDDLIMQEHIFNTYTQATEIAIKIMQFLDRNYHLKVSSEELTYLIVHINRNL